LANEERYHHDAEPRLNPVATVLAWLVPGLGHWILGYRRRAKYIAAGILGLYLAGLLIGGVNIINRTDGFWWYCGQVCVGPETIVINYWREHHLPPDDPKDQTNYTYARPSYAKVNEVGTLYATLAGLLNLIAILDVLYKAPCAEGVGRRTPSRRREDSA